MSVIAVLVVALLGYHGATGQGYGNSTYGKGYQTCSTQYNTGYTSGPDLPGKSHNYPTSNQGCFPNIIAKPVAADPASRLGCWYEYRLAYKDGQAYNAQFSVKAVNKGTKFIPGTYIPILHVVQDDYRWITLDGIQSYGSGSGTGYGGAPQGAGYGSAPAYGGNNGYKDNYKQKVNCNYNFIDIWSRYDGQDIYELFDPASGPVNPIPSVVWLLYSEPGERGWEIQYQCDQPNEQTYKCDKTVIYVNTRVHPNQMSKEEQYRIDDTIDRVLQPYCMTKNDLQKVIFRDDLYLEQCNMSPPDAFRNLVIGADVGLPDRAGGPAYGGQAQGYAAPRPY